MRKPIRVKSDAAAPSCRDCAVSELSELALLEEFTRHDSVASLAGAIAARLGRKSRPKELVERAGLALRRGPDRRERCRIGINEVKGLRR
jgi:hypothetical protein